MKKTLLALLASVLFFTACKKNNSEDIQPVNPKYSNTEGSCSMTILGEKTHFNGLTFEKNEKIPERKILQFYLLGNDGDGTANYVKLEFYLANFYLKKGQQKISASRIIGDSSYHYQSLHSGWTTWLSFDILGDRYEVYERDSLHNYLELYDINEQTGWVKGRFQCTYFRTRKGFENFPDTLRITDANFTVLVKE